MYQHFHLKLTSLGLAKHHLTLERLISCVFIGKGREVPSRGETCHTRATTQKFTGTDSHTEGWQRCC